MATDSLDDLKQAILDLSGEDRARLFHRLAQDAASTEETPLDAYCREYPEDPLCGGATRMGTAPRSIPAAGASEAQRHPGHDYRSHVQGFPSGGGCTEAWEFLSAMRGH